tara:strand:- start:14 stop:214 length:201 start_codon:yes stop_codon:yes gene_type:complete
MRAGGDVDGRHAAHELRPVEWGDAAARAAVVSAASLVLAVNARILKYTSLPWMSSRCSLPMAVRWV